MIARWCPHFPLQKPSNSLVFPSLRRNKKNVKKTTFLQSNIRNFGCACLAQDHQDAESVAVDVVAKVPLEVQTQFVLDAQQPCLVVVGGRGVAKSRYDMKAGCKDQVCVVIVCSSALVSPAGLEFQESKFQTVHASAVWKAGLMGRPPESLIAAFQKELAAVQDGQTKSGKKRTAASIKVELAQAPKKVCTGLSGAWTDAAVPGATGGA